MEVIYYRSPRGNFGDDLNGILWRELLPPACFAAPDAVLLGIGSIFREDFLSCEATRNKRVFVLGTGAGTGPLPLLWPNADWNILALRGPLSAKLLNRPDAAVTDSALLLLTAPALVPPSCVRSDIVFFPHYNSLQHGRWKEVCALAGFGLIDAHAPPRQILRQLSRARLVITEAMHGAIVADALRIPWIPVLCSPQILPFKWHDWTRSLELTYRPHVLRPSSGWETLRHFAMRWTDPRHTRIAPVAQDDQDYIDDFCRRFGNVTADALYRKPRLSGRAMAPLRRSAAIMDHTFVPRAAEALYAISKRTPQLSTDAVLTDRLTRLAQAVDRLTHALSA